MCRHITKYNNETTISGPVQSHPGAHSSYQTNTDESNKSVPGAAVFQTTEEMLKVRLISAFVNNPSF